MINSQLQVHDVDTNTIQVIICLLGGISCLLPLYVNPTSKLERSPLRQALPSQSNRDFSVSALSLMLPLLLDLTAELINSAWRRVRTRSEAVKIHDKKSLLNSMERATALFGAAIVPLSALLPENTANWAYVHVCCQKCQLILVAGAVLISMNRYDVKYWTTGHSFFSLFGLVSGTVTLSFLGNVETIDAEKTSYYVSYTAYAIVLAAAASFIWCSFLWLNDIVPTLFPLILESRNDNKKVNDNYAGTPTGAGHLLFPALYVVMSIILLCMLILLSALYHSMALYDANALNIYNLSFLAYVLFVSFVSIRMMKYEIFQALYARIESKKMYVRYISHELRTPLNSAFLGLKLLSDDFEKSKDPRDVERCDVLLDVQSACRTSVEILNDLLCFDKLESGILEMHRHEVKIKPFILDCTSMFNSQAKEAGVKMTILLDDTYNSSASPQTGAEHIETGVTSILDTDTVFMDKFKMDQVLRNLLSNALKFTPSGGFVTVRASFIPNKDPYTPPVEVQEMIVKSSSAFSIYKAAAFLYQLLRCCMHFPRAIKVYLSGSTDAAHRRFGSGDSGHVTDGASDRSVRRHPNSPIGSGDDSATPSNETADDIEKQHRGTYDNIMQGAVHRSGDINLNSNTNINLSADRSYNSHPEYCALRPTADRPYGFNLNSSRSFSVSNVSSAKKSDCTRSSKKISPPCSIGPDFIHGDGVDSVSGRGNSNYGDESTMYGKLRIVVSDTGAGMSEVNLRRLFKEIVQFSPEVLQAGGGSGLGLWITNSIVTMHSGTVHAYSAGAGMGCSFTVEIAMQRKCHYIGRRNSYVVDVHEPLSHSRHTKPTVTSDMNTPCEEDDDAVDGMNSRVKGDLNRGATGPMCGAPFYPKACISFDSHLTDTLVVKLDHLQSTNIFLPSALPPNPAPRAPLEEEWIFPHSPQSPVERENEVREPRTGFGPELLPPECARYDILVVDDSTLNRKMLKRVFTSSGYIYDEAVDGVSAVAKVKSRMTGESGRSEYDAILMDFVMPNMDGPTATEIIRGLGYKGLIFGVTGKSQENDIAYFSNKGADGVLSKPFDPAVFLQLMTKMHARAEDCFC